MERKNVAVAADPSTQKLLQASNSEARDCGRDATRDDDDDMACGIGSFRPDVMQNCRGMGCFTLTYGMTGIVTSALSVYISSQITTLEKQFNFSSSVSGFLMSCNDFGYLCTTLLMSYYTRRVHIPRALALSTVIYGISGLLCTVAYFGTRAQVSSPNINGTFRGASANATCLEFTQRTKASFSISEEWRSAAIILLAVGMSFQGVAKSPRHPFLGTYVDDNVPKTKTTLYLGTISGLSTLGPAIAFTLGGVFSKMYVTLEETNMSPRDPRWLGAWWLGFLIFGSSGLIVGVPLLFFPRRLRQQRDPEILADEARTRALGKTKLVLDFKGFLKALSRLVLNPVYICVVMASSFQLMGISGMIAFMPKYMETQFIIPAWQANILLGAVNVLAASIGTITGGCVISRLKLSPVACLKLMLGCMLVSTSLMSFGFVIGCDQPVIISSGLAYARSRSEKKDSSGLCVENCNCDEVNFFPVCGGDNRNYFSPCHAGCSSMDKQMVFTDCKCLTTNTSLMARGGLCEPDCHSLYIYVPLTFLGAFLTTMIVMPGFIVNIRSINVFIISQFRIALAIMLISFSLSESLSESVRETDKPLAMGFSAFMGTLIGWFPGPVIFGALTDTACLIWNSTCSSTGACSMYNIVQFRYRYHALLLGLRMITILLLTTALFVCLCTKKIVFQTHADISSKQDTDGRDKQAQNGIELTVKKLGLKIQETDIM